MVSRYLRPTALIAMLSLCSQAVPAHAQGQALREMHHAMWTARDGAPQIITEIEEHPDGTLWLGSESGLFSFDGQTFRRFQSRSGDPELPAGEVYSLLVTKSGTLWVSFYRVGIARISAGRVIVFSHVDTEAITAGQQLREAPDGSVWAIDDQRLLRFGAEGTWQHQPTPSAARLSGIFVDSANTLWLGQGGVLYRRPLSQDAYTPTDVRIDVVTGFAETPSGEIWVNDYDANTSLGRTHRVSTTGDSIGTLPQSLFTSGSVASTADGSLIIASFAAGVRRFLPEEASSRTDLESTREPDLFARDHGLSSDATGAVMVDSRGNIWIGGARGLDRLRPSRLTRYLPGTERSNWAVCASKQGEVWVANTLGEIYSASGTGAIAWPGVGDPLFSLACADGGRSWFANSRGLWAVAGDRVTALAPIDGLPEREQVKVVATSDHTLYATVAGPFHVGSAIWQYKDGQWARLAREGELGAGGYATYIDRSDGLWIGHANGVAVAHTTDSAQVFSSGEPGLGFVYAFLDTARGMFGAGTNGLAVLRESRFEMLTFDDPSLARGVRGLVEARSGDLWLNAASGLVQVPVAEIESALTQPTYPMKAQLIREGDYVGATQRALNYLDTAARDAQGRLWFATRNGVVHIDPARDIGARAAPKVTIRSIVADGEPVDDDHVIAPATRTLAIQYFGVNLTAPEDVIYRYRLEGFDETWQEAGARTEAFYTRLPPGRYTFSVMASNGDGPWTAPVSSALFTVLPSFYQTRGFAAVMAVFVLLAIGVIHKARVRQISRVMSARFDERLAERTRVARELHDTLLQTVHGSKLVADRALRDTTDRDQVVRALEQLSIWLGQAATEGRAALHSLRASTTETNNLAGALRRAIDECRHHAKADIELIVHGDARQLHPVVRDEVYRIGYEAIRNACAHSSASRIDVVLEYGHNLTLRVRDNGVGIEVAVLEGGKQGHFGLRGMRERAERIGGKLTLMSTTKNGTVVTLNVPGPTVFRSS